MLRSAFYFGALSLALCAPFTAACSTSNNDHQSSPSAGAPSNGGTSSSGAANSTAGAATGGVNANGGATAVAGSANGGTPGGAGTALSAGTTGAAGSSVFVAPADPCATALYCDDFESYDTTPGGKWTVHTNSAGTVAIDTTEHASGTKSAKVSTLAASSATAFLRLQDASIFPIAGNVVYGRMMFYLESAPTESVHWTMIDGLGLVPGQTYHAYYRFGGQLPIMQGTTFVGTQLMANYDTPDWYSDMTTPGSDCWHHSNGRIMPVAKWTCVEWEFDGPNNGMYLWLDDALAPELTIMMGQGDGCVNNTANFTWTAPNFASIDLGWESYQEDDPRTAYVDDVVISTTRIGCPTQ